MKNIFTMLKKQEEALTKSASDKKWWERNDIRFNRNAIDPTGNYYDEQSTYEMIKRGDLERLKRFSK